MTTEVPLVCLLLVKLCSYSQSTVESGECWHMKYPVPAAGRVRPVTCHDTKLRPHTCYPPVLSLSAYLAQHPHPFLAPSQPTPDHRNPQPERKCWLFGQRRVRDVDLLPVFRKLDCVISHLLCTAGSRGINREKSTNIQTENYLSSVDLIRTDVLIVLNKAN